MQLFSVKLTTVVTGKIIFNNLIGELLNFRQPCRPAGTCRVGFARGSRKKERSTFKNNQIQTAPNDCKIRENFITHSFHSVPPER